MGEDILQRDAAPRPAGAVNKKKGNHISVMAGILAIMLAIVMIIFGERVLFDLNKNLNPAVVDAGTSVNQYDYKAGLQYESSALSSQRISYQSENETEYKLYRMLTHSAFVIPVFLLMFVLYYWVWHKKDDSPFKVVVVGYLVFGFWMMLRLIIEIGGYVLERFANIGVYLVLLFLAAIFTWLMIVVQKQIAKKNNG